MKGSNIATDNQPAREKKSGKKRLKSGTSKEIFTLDVQELIMTLIVINSCLAMVFLSKVIVMKVVYALIINIVGGTTIYFRGRRLDRQISISHDLESKLADIKDSVASKIAEVTAIPVVQSAVVTSTATQSPTRATSSNTASPNVIYTVNSSNDVRKSGLYVYILGSDSIC